MSGVACGANPPQSPFFKGGRPAGGIELERNYVLLLNCIRVPPFEKGGQGGFALKPSAPGARA